MFPIQRHIIPIIAVVFLKGVKILNEIISPDFTGNDSQKIDELYRYVQEFKLETEAEIKGLSKQIKSIANSVKGGENP